MHNPIINVIMANLSQIFAFELAAKKNVRKTSTHCINEEAKTV